MKKIKLLITSILILFLLIMPVYAETTKGGFKNSWINSDISIEYQEALIEVEDGYLIGGYNDDFLGQVVKVNKQGEEADSVTLEDEFTIVGLHEKDGNYYVIALDDWWFISLYVLDENLEIVDSITTDYYLYDYNDVIYFGEDSVYITSIGLYNHEGVADENDDQYLMLEIGYDLKTTKITEYEDDWNTNRNLLLEVYPIEYYFLFQYKSFREVPVNVATDNKVIAMVQKNSPTDGTGTALKLYNYEDGNLINEHYIEESLWWYVDVTIIEDYIYAIGTNYNNIDVFDLEGNLVEQIDLRTLYPEKELEEVHISADNITPLADGFVLTYSVCDIVDDCAVNCKNSILEYRKPYNIITKTDGNGTITTSKDVEYTGNEITFTITPNEGYVLSEVKVTDSKGNIVTFTDYTFTMPNADVTIEAIFIKETPKEEPKEEKNPETSDIVIVMFIITAIISGTLIIRNHKKLNWMK